MKRSIGYICVVVLLIMAVAITGCGKDEEKSDSLEEKKDSKPQYIYDQLQDSETAYFQEDMEIIKQGITDWAKGNLLVGTDVDEEKRKQMDEQLYNMIVSEYDLKKVKADREGFYNGSDVEVGLVSTDIMSAVQVTYEEQNLGKVQCATAFYGTKNGQTFTRVYNMTLVISYENQTVTVKEIGEISWM